MRGVELFRDLDAGPHGTIDFRPVGSVRLATAFQAGLDASLKQLREAQAQRQ